MNYHISKRRIIGLLIMAASSIWALSQPAQAQDATPVTTLKIGVGECSNDPKGACSTYTKMFRELRKEVGDTPGLKLDEQQTKGSVECADLLIGNQLNGCIMQADVLFSRKRNEDLSSLKTLVALHTEEVHFIAPVASGLQKKGSGLSATLSLGMAGKEEVVISTVSDLGEGMSVGAVQGSGSAVTARLIKAEGELKYTVVLFKSTDELKAALAAKQIQAAVFVGGQKLPVIDTFGADYKILPFDQKLVAALKDVYTPSKVTYSGLNANGVQTVSTRAELVVYEYKTPKMVAALASFRTAALKGIPELAETTGTHAKWKEVARFIDANGPKGKWAWYELPDVKPVAAATKPAKK